MNSDMTDNSRQLKLNVFDREKPPGGKSGNYPIIAVNNNESLSLTIKPTLT